MILHCFQNQVMKRLGLVNQLSLESPALGKPVTIFWDTKVALGHVHMVRSWASGHGHMNQLRNGSSSPVQLSYETESVWLEPHKRPQIKATQLICSCFFFTVGNCAIIRVCGSKLLNLWVVCYTAIANYKLGQGGEVLYPQGKAWAKVPQRGGLRKASGKMPLDEVWAVGHGLLTRSGTQYILC